MKKSFKYMAVGGLVVFSLGSQVVQAAEFQPAGVRALGMGGAGVASIRDTNASYWNPAAFGFFGEDDAAMKASDNNGMGDKDFGISADVGAGVSLQGNLAGLVDTIGKINYGAVQTAINGNTTGTLAGQPLLDSLTLINKLDGLNAPGTGLRILANGMGGVRIKNFGMGVQVLGEIGVSAKIDTQNLGLAAGVAGVAGVQQAVAALPLAATTTTYFSAAQQAQLVGLGYTQATINQVGAQLAATPAAQGQQATIAQALNTVANTTGSLSNNNSTIHYQGAIVTEVPLSYGYAITPNFSIGGSLKYIQAQVIDGYTGVFNQNSNNFSFSQFKETKSGFGIDMGAMYRMPNFQAGLVLRNLNSPKFKHSWGYVYEMKPQAKLGVSYMPWNTVTMELDADLTKNKSALRSYDTQYINAGLEWNVFHIVALRAGAYKNMAQNDIGTVYTAGLGINLWAARLDIGGAMSTKKSQYQGQSFPREARVSAALNIDF
ncbi:MAG: conjugal transfer protein TraF [Mariprofundaceae bacterium]|nr:conjugal transfer protein TraF [Mariprofundaceae bacterium]